ncbi:MAG: SCP2 sterol-binding domain-containing protein [Solirubrobacteraceae bacterium]
MTRLASALLRGAAQRAARLDRRRVTHRAILRALPLAVRRRFDPASAGDLDAVFELRVRDPGGRPCARYTLRIAGARCEVRTGMAPQAGAAVEIGAGDMIRLAGGAVGWPELLAARRLELSGDPFLALRFPNLFRLPAQAG